MSTTQTTTVDPPPHTDAPVPLVAEILAVLLQEPGRPAIGRVIDDLSCDHPRPMAIASVLTAALMR
jgi:hypothetical protein